MLFIRNYNRKSLDRSTISSLDRLKQRTRNIDGEYNILLKAITGILSTIAYIGELLGLIKVNLVNVVNETKNIIEENGLIGADNALAQIDKYINTGDKAIESAKTELEIIKQEIEEDQPQVCSYESNPGDTCGEGSKSDQNDEVESISNNCGEAPDNTSVTDTDVTNPDTCSYCLYRSADTECKQTVEECAVCSYNGGVTDLTCGEETNTDPGEKSCEYSQSSTDSCGETYGLDLRCSETDCRYSGDSSPTGEGCNYYCSHNSGCSQSSMPESCSYTCEDGYDASCNQQGCAYGGDSNCNYSSVPNNYSCKQSSEIGGVSDESDGGPCGEGTCGMNTKPSECTQSSSSGGSSSCSQNSCGEGCGQNTTPDDGVDYAPVDSGGGGNVICTKIISELIPDEKWAYEASVYNIKMALRNGLNKKALREYKNGLGLEILAKLPKEEYQKLLNHKLIHVWLLMKSDPKEGTRLYSKVVYDLAVKYDIDLSKYPECIKWFEHYGFLSNKV